MGNRHKLDILVPQYNETDAIIKPLLDSIALQQCVDFDDVGVIIVNDGSDTSLTDGFLKSYPFDIDYVKNEHLGVSATRNKCLDLSRSDYVMFCDADDMFYNMCGLWIIFREIDDNGGFDSLISNFVEETCDPVTKQHIFVNHEMDSTFVHGKIHRRKYLINNNIRFNDKLTIHEDSYFNILVQNCSVQVKYCQTPFYLWSWRDESVCRHDPKYILKTYSNMLDSNTELIYEFKRRHMVEKARSFVAFMIFDAYYTMCKPEWLNQENQEYRHTTELRFKKYYSDFKSDWDCISDADKMQISNGVRSRQVGEGMQMENITINDWLEHISELT